MDLGVLLSKTTKVSPFTKQHCETAFEDKACAKLIIGILNADVHQVHVSKDTLNGVALIENSRNIILLTGNIRSLGSIW